MAGSAENVNDESPERARGGDGRWTKERRVYLDNERPFNGKGYEGAKGLKGALPLDEREENRRNFSFHSRSSYFNQRPHGKNDSSLIHASPASKNLPTMDTNPQSVPRSSYFFEHDDRSATGARGRYNPRYSGGRRGGFQTNRLHRHHSSYPTDTFVADTSAGKYDPCDPDDRWVSSETESPFQNTVESTNVFDKNDEERPEFESLSYKMAVKVDSPAIKMDENPLHELNESRERRKSIADTGDRSEGDKRRHEMNIEPSRSFHRELSSSRMKRPLDNDTKRVSYDYGRVNDRSELYRVSRRYSHDSYGERQVRRNFAGHRYGNATGSRYVKPVKWGHDMFDSTNRSPSPQRDETLEKIEELLSS